MDGRPRLPGRIDESRWRFKPRERKVAEYLAEQGNDVTAVPESTSKRPDALINETRRGVDHRVEFKSPRPTGDTRRRAAARVREALDREQARQIVLDLRDIHDSRGRLETEDGARHIVEKVRGRLSPGELDYLRIIGNTFDLTFGEFP
jgi:hypothetical protein